jgi:NAD-dependent protein deacetylase/lipoamidase
LINYAPKQVPKFIIDKNIPYSSLYNITAIQKPATEGIVELISLLSE